MENKKIVIAGGTGFIGQALAERWGRNNTVIVLSRRCLTARDGYNVGYCSRMKSWKRQYARSLMRGLMNKSSVRLYNLHACSCKKDIGPRGVRQSAAL